MKKARTSPLLIGLVMIVLLGILVICNPFTTLKM